MNPELETSYQAQTIFKKPTVKLSTKGTFGRFGCGFAVLPRLMSKDCKYFR